MFFLAVKAFFALPTFPVFHVPSHCLSTLLAFSALHQCQRTALLQSDTGVWFGRCGVSRAILHQPVPSKLFTIVVLFVSQSHTANIILAPSTTHAHYMQDDTFIEPDTYPHNFTFLLFLTLNRTLLLEVVVTPFFFAYVDHAFVLMRSN